MILKLYQVTDGDNVMNKTLSDTPLTLTIRLKRDTDIINPMLILSAIDGVDYNNYNYAEIEELNRFYFIDNATNLNNKRWQLNLSCDVIETYKDEILLSHAKFKRSIRSGDYINTADFDTSIIESIEVFKSDIILDGIESVILTTIGVGSPSIS